ncbi:MAG: amidohydrolase family protein [Acidobacteriota bacterium]|nr:amidohydrolase family protein [Acidobacteriota bacterium]
MMKNRQAACARFWGLGVSSAFLICVICVICGLSAAPPRAYDLVITNGLIVDGSGHPGFQADLGIRDGRIEDIGNLSSAPANARIDAHGEVVSPGFIDPHVNIEDPIKLSQYRLVADNFLLQGVTTVITGNCGFSAPDIAALFQKLDRLKMAVNVATLVGHNTIRQQVCGPRTNPTPQQIARMQSLVRAGIEAGALGMSSGLCYQPGVYANEDEVVALVHVVALEHAIYTTHLRNESAEEQTAVDEAVRTAQRAGIPRLHICHFKVAAQSQWGTARGRLDAARQAAGPNIRLTSDLYPYTSLSTTLEYLIPPEAFPLLGGPAPGRAKSLTRAIDMTLDKLHRDGWQDYANVRVAYSVKHKEWIGMTIPAIVRSETGGDSLRTQASWILTHAASGDVQIIAEVMNKQDVGELLAAPDMVIGSDSSIHYRGLGRPHPRGQGTFPRILAEYVRNQQLLTLEAAVHRTTGLTAEIFALPRRGQIRVGYWADLVIFDPALIQDRATSADPWSPPKGIDYVIVNGAIAVQGAKLTGKLAGRPVTRVAPSTP